MTAYANAHEHTPLLPIRIFLASPGDLFPVRTAVKEVIEELNHDSRYEDKYKFILYAYEDRVPPVIAEEPQRTIDNYLLRPDAPDIFLCFFWRRLGSPTKDMLDKETDLPYPSGTVYELLTAYRARRQLGTPEILLYRCTAPAQDPEKQTPEQQKALDTFIARFLPGGDLTGLIDGEFADPSLKAEDLVGKLHEDIIRVVETKLRGQFESAWRGLLEHPTPPALYLPPGLPPDYVERVEEQEKLRRLILGSQRKVGVVAVLGQGGLGKTVLAKALCLRDGAIRGAFPDGVLWAELGQNPDVLAVQRAWIKALGSNPTAATTVREGTVVLQGLLQERAVLLVLDGLWQEGVVEAFLVGGERCRLLITTRDGQTVPGTQLLELGVMQRSESLQLLQQTAPAVDTQTAWAIADRLGDLPLALNLVGTLLSQKIPWDVIRERLDQHDLGGRDTYTGRLSRIYGVVATSVAALPGWLDGCFEELAIFPAHEALDTRIVAKLWEATRGWQPSTTEEALGTLRTQSLLQSGDTIHDLVRDYLLSQYHNHPERLRALHGQFVGAFGPPEQWPLLPAEETYAWAHLVGHLVAAGKFDQASTLVSDGRYLRTKIALHGAEAAARDVDLSKGAPIVAFADTEITAESGLHLLAATLRRSAHVLDRDVSQLENQLFGRLGGRLILHDAPTPPIALRLAWPSLTSGDLAAHHLVPRHMGAVRGCAFSPDGSLLATAGDDGTARLWEVRSGRPVRVLQEQSAAVRGCAFSPDGSLLATAGDDGTARLWEVRSGRPVRVLVGPSAISGRAFSPNGTLLATASSDRIARLWEVANGHLSHTLAGHEGLVNSCAFSPDGTLLATAGGDGAVLLWEVASGRQIAVIEGHDTFVLGCAFSPDGTLLATVSGDETARLWDIQISRDKQRRPLCRRNTIARLTITLRQILQGHNGHVNSCGFSAAGTLLATAGGDRTIRLWDVNTGRQLAHVTLDEGVSVCASHPHELLFAAGDNAGGIHLLRVLRYSDKTISKGTV